MRIAKSMRIFCFVVLEALDYFTNQFKNIEHRPQIMPNSSPKSCQTHFPSIPKSYQKHPTSILNIPPKNSPKTYQTNPKHIPKTFQTYHKIITKTNHKHTSGSAMHLPELSKIQGKQCVLLTNSNNEWKPYVHLIT